MDEPTADELQSPPEAFPIPQGFENLTYAKIRVIQPGGEVIGDLLPRYYANGCMSANIDVMYPPVFERTNEPIPWDKFVHAGYIPVKSLLLSTSGVMRIKVTGDASVPYSIIL